MTENYSIQRTYYYIPWSMESFFTHWTEITLGNFQNLPNIMITQVRL